MELDADLARRAFADGVARYFADRRCRVGPFVDRHFSLAGSLRLHRAALGWDVVRAPLNLTLAGPQVALGAASALARKAGAARLAGRLGREILLRTDVAREIAWLIHTDLLELPYRDGARHSARDALAECVLGTPVLTAALAEPLATLAGRGADDEFRARLDRALADYAVSRAAAAEITTGLLSLGAGAAAFNKLTPGAASLGPTLAAIWAQQAAVASFPLGGWLGGAWYGLFPAAPSAALVAGATGGLMLTAAGFAAFAGIVADPIQRAAGLHQARLRRMIDALERQMADPAAPGFAVRDQYVARLLDLFDLLGAALRLARP